MARLVNSALRANPSNEIDAADELITTTEILDQDPSNYTLGVAARIEGALLLARQGRIAEAEAMLDRPLRLILRQLRLSPESASQQTLTETVLLFSAAAYADIQASRLACQSAITTLMILASAEITDATVTNLLFAHLQEQLRLASNRAYRAVVNAKAAWNYATRTRPDVQAFALERYELALREAEDDAAVACVARHRAQFGEYPQRHWLIDPTTWIF
jgi:hypothetical protein